jgi:tetratricopeptide (TPR) repeat protein
MILIGLGTAGLARSFAADDQLPAVAKSGPPSQQQNEPGEATIPWSKADTKIANHYIQILQGDPEYGRVLDLLWDLYRRHHQEALLLSYFKSVASQPDAAVAKILYGHLLRKKDELEPALSHYQQALAVDPNQIHALRGAAEILDQQENLPKALAYYDRLTTLLPGDHKDALAIRLRRADLLKSAGRVDEAVEVWNALLAEHPQDNALRTKMVALLLESGHTEDAIRVLKKQQQSSDPEERLAALETLSGLYGFIDDFDAAVEATEKARALLHFKDYRYKQVFKVQGMLYERFGRVKELEDKLLKLTTGKGSSEKSLRDLAEFFRMTAKPKQEQVWVERLTEIAPNDGAYSLRLAELMIENEEFEQAAAQLDKLIAAQDPPPIRLIFMRSLAALYVEGKKGAEAVLEDYLNSGKQDAKSPETLNRLLAFARQHYLDRVVENLLQGHLAGIAVDEDGKGKAASLELARFFRERGQMRKAQETIAAYAGQKTGSPKERAGRLTKAAEVYADLKLYDEAEEALGEALRILPSDQSPKLALASVQAERNAVDKAVATYNQIWQDTSEFSGQTEIDSRLFSLLRAQVDKSNEALAATPPLPAGPPQTLEDFRRLARAATLNANAGIADEPLPEKLTEFYERIKGEAKTHPDLRHKYRVAWWAFKIQDYRETHHQLADLHDPSHPIVEVEKLMLDLAELTGNTLLVGSKLELLSKIDKENENEYLRRWAEFRFNMDYQDQAVRLLEKLARQEGATLSTLKSLAEAYKRQGRTEDQVAVWQNAYEQAGINEKRQIIKQLSTTLLDLGNVKGALDAQLDLIKKDQDPVQKRRLFEAQLTLATRTQQLPWLKKRYTELVAQEPFGRFYPEALGRVHQASGDTEAAYQALKRAYYMAGDNRKELLYQLGELADRSKDLQAAIYYRRQLIASDEGGPDMESWKLLVEMLEKDLRVAEADLTRERFEGKFAQDSEFLKQAAHRYLKIGQAEKARTIFGKLVSLRPWDAALWLELGLLQRESGDDSEALASFHKAIETTVEDTLPQDKVGQGLAYLPVVDGGWDPGSDKRPETEGLGLLAAGIREYRFIETTEQDELISWLRRPHPEFDRVPSTRAAVRLRAIEEAARLSKNDPVVREKWLSQWQPGSPRPEGERLWANFHAGDFEQAQAILDGRLLPPGDARERFGYALLSLRMGHADALFAPGPHPNGGRHSSFAVLASLLLLQEDPDAISQETLESVLQQSVVTPSIARHLLNNLQLDGKLESAYKAGVALARTQAAVDADFLYQVARSAEWLGWEQERLFWLERSLGKIEPNPIRGLPVSFYGIASELYGLRESAEEKSAVLEFLAQKTERHPGATQAAILESRLSLAMISGDRDRVLNSLKELTEYMVELGRPKGNQSIRRGFPQVEHWIGMERLLNEHVRHLPGGISAQDFYDAMGSVDQVEPQDPAVMAQFRQFSMARLMWLLTEKSPPERRHLVAEFYSRLKDETLRLELARTLESRGYYRETIPVYLDLIKSEPEDFTLVRGFFSACASAQDYQPALELIDQYLGKELPISKGMTPLYLVQKHAFFLGLARDSKALLTFGEKLPALALQDQTDDEEQAELANEYYRALLDLYRARGESDEELGVLFRLKARKSLTRAEQLEGGRIFLQQGNANTAAEWLEGLELDQSQATIETDAIRLLADIYAAAPDPDKGKLAGLARQALDYDDNDLIIHIAKRLREAGFDPMADSALLLRIRSAKAGSAKPALLLSLIKGRLYQGTEVAHLEAEIRALVAAFTPASPLLPEWFEFVRTESKSHREEWEKLFAKSGHGAGLIWRLTSNVVAQVAETQGLDPTAMDEAEVLCVLEQLAESRRGKEAEQLLASQALASRQALGFSYPARAIRVLGKLGSDTRIAEVHSRLIKEPISEAFRRRVRIAAVPSFDERWNLPAAFAEAGYPELAGSLYRTYLDAVQKDGLVSGEFLAANANFLTERRNYPAAENLLVSLFGQSSHKDDKALVAEIDSLIKLYKEWKLQGQQTPEAVFNQRLERYHLTSGLRARIDEIRQAGQNNSPNRESKPF